MPDTIIQPLCAALERELERDPSGPGVSALLEDAARHEACWQPYRLFAPHAYARNLIRCCDLYEIMVICWRAGDRSPIHNHAGQHCWMVVLEGRIEEISYAPPVSGRGGSLPVTAEATFEAGQVAYIHDDIALHAIRPVDDAPAVTLHVYAQPIRACNMYCPDTGTISKRELAYYSVDGCPVTP